MGRPTKRTDVLDAARRAFAQSGYTVRIAAIAKEANVSTRTIYNHFPGGKDELFATAIAESAGQVADALIAAITRHLDQSAALDQALVGLARDWLAPRDGFRDHFDMVRRMQADARDIPAAIRQAWHTAGPDRAVGALAEQFARHAGANGLDVTDPDLAASHYLSLTVGEVLQRGLRAADDALIDDLIRAGVRVFLHGYHPGPADRAI